MLGVEEDCSVSITSDWASADLAQVLAAGRASVLVPASGGSGSAVAAAGTTAVAAAGVVSSLLLPSWSLPSSSAGRRGLTPGALQAFSFSWSCWPGAGDP